jgi:O-antigen ligase
MKILKKKFCFKRFLFINLPSSLTVLLPFFLITGPFLSDLAISLCAILFIVNSLANWSEKFKIYYQNKFFIFFIFFWFTLVLSSLLSSDKIYSLQTSILYIRFGFFTLSTWFLLNNNSKIIITFFYVIFTCFFILIIDGGIQFFYGKNIFGWEIISTRISSFFRDELILGSYISRLFPLFFATYIIFANKYKNKYSYNYTFYFFIIFILADILVFLSGERVAFFYLNLSAFFIFFLSKKYSKLRILTLISSFFIMFIITLFQTQYKERIIDITVNQVLKQNNGFYIFSKEHEDHFKSAILMFNENKIIGIGPKQFRKNCDKKEFLVSFESCTTHPHNTYIQLLAEVGLLGFLQIFSFFLFLFYLSLKHYFLLLIKKKMIFNEFEIALISCFIITLWPLVPTGNFFGNWLNVIYYLPAGFLLYSLNKRNAKI